MTPVCLLALVVIAHPGTSTTTASRLSPIIIEADFWSRYGVSMTREGVELTPSFMLGDLDEIVAGSPEAERHAKHANLWAISNLVFGAASIALMVTDIILYNSRYSTLEGWPSFTPTTREGALGLTWFLSFTFGVISRYELYEELILTTNAYNVDAGRR
jgi:hypothetical protein